MIQEDISKKYAELEDLSLQEYYRKILPNPRQEEILVQPPNIHFVHSVNPVTPAYESAPTQPELETTAPPSLPASSMSATPESFDTFEHEIAQNPPGSSSLYHVQYPPSVPHPRWQGFPTALTSHPQLPPPQQLANSFFEPFAMAMVTMVNKCTESNQETLEKFMKDQREQRAEERAIRAQERAEDREERRKEHEDFMKMFLMINNRNTGPVAQGSSQGSVHLAVMAGSTAPGSQNPQGFSQGPADLVDMAGSTAPGSFQGASVGPRSSPGASFGPGPSSGASFGPRSSPGASFNPRSSPGASFGPGPSQVPQGSSRGPARLAAMAASTAPGSSQGASVGSGPSQVPQGSSRGPARLAAMAGSTAQGSSSSGPVAQGPSQGSSPNPAHVLAMRGAQAPDSGASRRAQGPAPGPFRAPRGVPGAPQAPYHHPAVPRPGRRNRPPRTVLSNRVPVGYALETSFDRALWEYTWFGCAKQPECRFLCRTREDIKVHWMNNHLRQVWQGQDGGQGQGHSQQ